ncbi:paramyosin-like [Daphnia carinata]|uniref:paramyosin-like n=1 Tax=Daphnia carinata TaxID=120202 RepID=UPI00257E23FC|nr:paramyosin-like [Daphnia carinata]
MDNRQVLINILQDMQNNIKVVLQLAKQPSDEPLQERFYHWLKERFPLWKNNEEIPDISTCNQSIDETVDTVNRFAQYIADEIAKGQTVDGCRTRLPRLREERERMETRLRQLKVDREHEEALQRSELQSRLDLIQDLKTRLRETEERTTSCVRLAKECREMARKEWDSKNQKPLEEQKLHFELLSAQLANLMKENAITENQLTKCCEERKQDVETMTIKMNEDIRQRQEEVDNLKREVSLERKKLQELEDALAIVTIDYDLIMEQRQKEAEEALRRQIEEQIREKAAIKIQRWYRFILFRTIRARRRRKKSKRKVSKEVKRAPIERNKIAPEEARPNSEYERDTSRELGSTEAVLGVLVARKSAIMRNRSFAVSDATDLNTEDTPSEFEDGKELGKKNPPKPKNKKTTSAVRPLTVKKGTNSADKEVKIKPTTSQNRSSQTDNRVPKSKKLFR